METAACVRSKQNLFKRGYQTVNTYKHDKREGEQSSDWVVNVHIFILFTHPFLGKKGTRPKKDQDGLFSTEGLFAGSDLLSISLLTARRKSSKGQVPSRSGMFLDRIDTFPSSTSLFPRIIM